MDLLPLSPARASRRTDTERAAQGRQASHLGVVARRRGGERRRGARVGGPGRGALPDPHRRSPAGLLQRSRWVAPGALPPSLSPRVSLALARLICCCSSTSSRLVPLVHHYFFPLAPFSFPISFWRVPARTVCVRTAARGRGMGGGVPRHSARSWLQMGMFRPAAAAAAAGREDPGLGGLRQSSVVMSTAWAGGAGGDRV